MKTLAVVSRKGGVGKSLLAANLAVAFEEAGVETVAIDLDPQGSLIRWAGDRSTDAPTVAAGLVARLSGMLAKASAAEIDLAIIDTPSLSDKISLGAITAADLILVPSRPAIFDLRSISETIDIVKLARKQDQAVIVLNAVPSRGSAPVDAEAFAKGYGVEIAPARITDRPQLPHALALGQGITEFEPKGKAASEIRALCAFLASRLDIPLRRK